MEKPNLLYFCDKETQEVSPSAASHLFHGTNRRFVAEIEEVGAEIAEVVAEIAQHGNCQRK